MAHASGGCPSSSRADFSSVRTFAATAMRGREPPWDTGRHAEDVLETVEVEVEMGVPDRLGFSFGAAQRPWRAPSREAFPRRRVARAPGARGRPRACDYPRRPSARARGEPRWASARDRVRDQPSFAAPCRARPKRPGLGLRLPRRHLTRPGRPLLCRVHVRCDGRLPALSLQVGQGVPAAGRGSRAAHVLSGRAFLEPGCPLIKARAASARARKR
jgi:hypothetical protein